MTAEHPEARLINLLLSLFSSDELRRLLRFSFPDSLSNSLPGPSQAPITVASAAVEAIQQHGLLDELWPRMIAERPRRKPEIEAVRALFARDETSQALPRMRDSKVRNSNFPDPGEEALDDEPRTRILFVLSCPPTEVQLDLQEELRQIRQELQRATHRDQFTCEFITAATYDDLRMALRTHEPHILHIACHGTPQDRLVFSNGSGNSREVNAAAIADLLDLFKDDLALVVLNACHSSAVARAIAEHIGLVVSMTSSVYDSSARDFARVLYESIAAGETIERAFRFATNALKLVGDAHIPELLPPSGDARQRRFVA